MRVSVALATPEAPPSLPATSMVMEEKPDVVTGPRVSVELVWVLPTNLMDPLSSVIGAKSLIRFAIFFVDKGAAATAPTPLSLTKPELSRLRVAPLMMIADMFGSEPPSLSVIPRPRSFCG